VVPAFESAGIETTNSAKSEINFAQTLYRNVSRPVITATIDAPSCIIAAQFEVFWDLIAPIRKLYIALNAGGGTCWYGHTAGYIAVEASSKPIANLIFFFVVILIRPFLVRSFKVIASISFSA